MKRGPKKGSIQDHLRQFKTEPGHSGFHKLYLHYINKYLENKELA
jgi:hypothetical protein